MKRKIMAMCLVIAMAATAIIGGTLAYFTDTDSAKNVMVTGGVNIIQNELQYNESKATLEKFVDSKPLYPVTDDANKDGMMDGSYSTDLIDKTYKVEGDVVKNATISTIAGTTGGTTKIFSTKKNVVDKIITVTNDADAEATGAENRSAYVRTLLAFEVPTMEYAKTVYADYMTKNGNKLPEHVKALDKDGKYVDTLNMKNFIYTVMHTGTTVGQSYTLPMENDDYVVITIDGVNYLVTEYLYRNGNDASILKAGETSHPSLKQVYLSANATNEDAQLVVGTDGNYDILALSQAVQTTGFDNATAAFNAAFGEITAENAAKWFADVK